MFIRASLETIAMTTDSRMDTLWYFPIWEYYVAMRMNELQPVQQCKYISPKNVEPKQTNLLSPPGSQWEGGKGV